MGQFPVEDPAQAVLADHEIAGPEVAVHQGVRRGSGPVLGEPAQADLEGGPGLGEGVVQAGQLRERVEVGQVRHLIGVDLMDPGQDLPQAAREPGPHGGVRLVAQQPTRDGLSF